MIRGTYEEPLILALGRYFQSRGYEVKSHAHLNIAWGKAISDVDVLAFNDKEIIAIEVKSKRDVFTKAFTQLDRIAPYVDRVFIATDDEVKANAFRKDRKTIYGILYIDLTYKEVSVKKGGRICNHILPSRETLCSLKRCCLEELALKLGVRLYQSKSLLSVDITRRVPPKTLKRHLKDIVVYQNYAHQHSDWSKRSTVRPTAAP